MTPKSTETPMTETERNDLQLWIRHGRIGTGRGYQAEVDRARRIEADHNRAQT